MASIFVGGGLELAADAAFQFGPVDAVASADRGREARQVALGDPRAGLSDVEKLRPIVIDAELAWLRTALQPFVGAAEIECRFRVDAPERRRQVLPGHCSQQRRSQP
jgi:hypothetical protein